MNSRNLRALTALAISALTLAGCGALEPARDTPPAAPAEARLGGDITIGITEPGPLDPLRVATRSGRMITSAVCDTLVAIDPETHLAKPGLVRKYVTASAGSTVTLLPDHDVHLSNGELINAKDLNRNFTALLEPVNSAPGKALAEPFMGGVLAKRDGDGTARAAQPLLVEAARERVTAAQPLNDFDVQLQSSPAYSGAVRTFAEIPTAPFSASEFEKDPQGFARNPICVGPYKLAAPYQKGDKQITLVRNETYPAINTAYTRGGAGWADRLVFRIYKDADAAFRAYQQGEVDVAALPASKMRKPGISDDELIRADATQVVYLGFATREEYQNTPAYRRGWSELIDREQLVADVFGVSGQVADGFFPPALDVLAGTANSVQHGGLVMPRCNLPAFDPAAGKAALADYVASDPMSVPDVIGVGGGDSGTGRHNIVSAVTKMWQEGLGFRDAFPYPLSADEIGETLGTPGGVWSAFEISYSSNALAPVAMFHDPQPYAAALFSRAGLTKGTNPGNFVDGAFDYQLKERFAASDDAVTRQQALDQMGEILCDQLPMLPLAYVSDVWAINTDTLASTRALFTGHDGLPLLRELYRK